MKKTVLLIALALVGCGSVYAQTAPMLQFSVGGVPQDFALSLDNSGLWTLAQPENVNGSQITNATLDFNPDPSINYGYGVYNGTGSTQTYTISFPQVSGSFSPLAINLAPGLYNVKASLGVTLTDGQGDGASFSQVGGTAYQQNLLNSTDIMDIGSGTLSVPSGASNPSQTFSFPAVTNPAYALGFPATTMSITDTFQLSPGDSASFSGSFTINAVPEPSSVVMGLMAAGAFAFLVVRSRGTRA
jgi:hypothetical protein